MSIYGITTSYYTAESGTEYVEVQRNGKSVILKWEDFHAGGRAALEILRARGMPIIGMKNCSALVEKVANADDFVPYPIIENVGWNGGNFASPCGRISSPTDGQTPKIAITPMRNKCSRGGSLSRWRKRVAKPIRGQSILQFCVLLMFAAPLLRLTGVFDNFGFEIIGKKATGKSSALRLASSVAGGSGRGPEGHYYVHFDTTLNALEDAMVVHSDLTLLLDEANLFGMGQTARALATIFKDVAFKLGGGTTRARLGSEGYETRLLFLSTSNEPLAALIGEHTEGAKAAADRLITIPIAEEREHGVLDYVPEDYSSPGEFIDAILAAASADYGQALPQFLDRLVNDRALDEQALRTCIAEYVAEFRDEAAVDPNDGSARRVADAFGLVFAAGRLAERYHVIPKRFGCGTAVLACYRLHLGRAQAGMSFTELLTRLARGPGVPHIGKKKAPPLSDAEFEEGLFVKEGRHGTELLIRADRINRFIPNWRGIKGREEIQALMITEKKRQQIYRMVSSRHDRIRVFSFRLEIR